MGTRTPHSIGRQSASVPSLLGRSSVDFTTDIAESSFRYRQGELWLETSRRAHLETGTIEQYEQHLRLHIVPFIGREKLSKLSAPMIRAYQDRLHNEGRSRAMLRGVIGSLGAILSDAQECGLVVRNAVCELRSRRRRGSGRQEHRNGKLKIGIDNPTPVEVRALLSTAEGKWKVFISVAVFTGMRASELRGLLWDHVDLKGAAVHVRQRADRRNVIGKLKSAAGERTVPLPPGVIDVLRERKLICPRKDGRLGFVFPTARGTVQNHRNITARGLIPTMIAAGIVTPELDAHGKPKRDRDGKPIVLAKYTGLHALRHFFASWCINRKVDGGLELPLKVAQERLGHASVVMTADTYGHLFPRGDDSAELAVAERALLGSI